MADYDYITLKSKMLQLEVGLVKVAKLMEESDFGKIYNKKLQDKYDELVLQKKALEQKLATAPISTAVPE